MSSPATVDTDSMLSDFSASLLSAAEVDKKRKKENFKKESNNRTNNGEFSGDKNLTENFNLNSVLSKIRDNGSAYVDTKKQGGRQVNKIPHAVQSDNKIESSYTKNKKNRDYYQNEKIADDKLHLTSKIISEGKLLHYISRTQLLSLVSLSVVIVGTSMYMLDSHVNNSIQETVQNVNAIYPVISHDADEKMEGKVLRTSSSSASTLIVPGEILLTEILPADTSEIPLVTSSVSALASEVRSLRKELEQVKETINFEKIKTENVKNEPEATIKKTAIETSEAFINNSISTPPAINDLKSVNNNSENKVGVIETKAKVVHKQPLVEVKSKKSKSSLMVNLVSLSNKSKANEIIKRLETSGLSPQLEEAVVNDKQVYRISVTGFTDRDEAMLFIQSAADKFGVKGSRIRKNNL